MKQGALVSVLLVVAACLARGVAGLESSSLELGGDGGGGKCNTTSDCGSNGECVPEQKNNATKVCRCDERYAGDFCQHKRKSKLAAFLLSILIGGTGADRFYLGFIGLGVAKLLINLLACVPACVATCLSSLCAGRRTEYVGIGDDGSQALKSSLCSLAGTCLSCCMSLGGLAWWLTDWILILQDDLGDSDGYSLYNNM